MESLIFQFQKDVKSIRLRLVAGIPTKAKKFQKDVKSIRLRLHTTITIKANEFQKDVKSIRLRPLRSTA